MTTPVRAPPADAPARPGRNGATRLRRRRTVSRCALSLVRSPACPPGVGNPARCTLQDAVPLLPWREGDFCESCSKVFTFFRRSVAAHAPPLSVDRSRGECIPQRAGARPPTASPAAQKTSLPGVWRHFLRRLRRRCMSAAIRKQRSGMQAHRGDDAPLPAPSQFGVNALVRVCNGCFASRHSSRPPGTMARAPSVRSSVASLYSPRSAASFAAPDEPNG